METVLKDDLNIKIYMVESKLENMAGVAGFEPTIARPKPAALPLGHAPVMNLYVYYTEKEWFFKDINSN